RRVALHPAQPQHAGEQILLEPALGSLRGEVAHEVLDLAFPDALVERNERVRRAHVAVVLRYLVLEDEVVSEGVPRKLAADPVVLVQVPSLMREDDVGREVLLELLEEVLDALP